jgi:hypothetical protein
MPKSRGRKGKPKPPPPSPHSQPTKAVHPEERRRLRSIIEWVLGISTILGLVGLVALLPRVTVDPDDSHDDPADSSSVSFKISNPGFIPLWNVSPSIGYQCIATANKIFITELSIHRPSYDRASLEMDGSYTIVLSDYVRGQIISGFVTFSISYYPWFFPIKRQSDSGFSARILEDKKVHWLRDTTESIEQKAKGCRPPA